MASAFGADERWRPSRAVRGLGDVHDEHESDAPEPQLAQPPTAVFVPAAAEPDEEGNAEIQLRRTDEGELALPVFTSVDTLVRCCGEEQPWVAFYAASLPDLVAATGADGIAQDVRLPQGDAEGA